MLSNTLLEKTARDIKLVVCDLDNTLLRPDSTLSERTRAAVRALRRKGVAFSICSGRVPAMLGVYTAALALTDPAVGANGAAVFDPKTGAILESRPLAGDVAAQVVGFCLNNRLDCCVLGAGFNLFAPNSRRIERFLGYNRLCAAAGLAPMALDTLGADFAARLAAGEVYKILVNELRPGDFETAAAFVEALPGAGHTSSDARLLDVVAPGVDKGAGVRALRRRLGLMQHEVWVFGDYLNDIAMFREAAAGIAMGNADPAVKAAADFVAPGCEQDGVAQVIERYLLK